MDKENTSSLNQLLAAIIQRNLTHESFNWLTEKAAQSAGKKNNYQLNLTFTSMPRRTGKSKVFLEEGEQDKLNTLLPGFSIESWTIDRLCRLWLLMQLDFSDKDPYINRVENLFSNAEMNEQVALYSSLPVLAYPEAWKLRCAEGIRSNIGTVLEAIMYHNPYPGNNLDEKSWNQMVLKAFFTDKDVNKIVGLDERNNQSLAFILFDYVEERWAAGRSANPQIWRLCGKYVDESHFYMLEKLMKEGDETDQKAGAIALSECSLEKATSLLDQHPDLKKDIEEKRLTWQML